MKLEDCCYICRDCGLPACSEKDPSPCEDHRVCADCATCDHCRAEVAADASLGGAA